jgi:hypothetical protein
MNIETIAFLACVASAAVFARLAYQRRMALPRGPYIEGPCFVIPKLDAGALLVDHLRWAATPCI